MDRAFSISYDLDQNDFYRIVFGMSMRRKVLKIILGIYGFIYLMVLWSAIANPAMVQEFFSLSNLGGLVFIFMVPALLVLNIFLSAPRSYAEYASKGPGEVHLSFQDGILRLERAQSSTTTPVMSLTKIDFLPRYVLIYTNSMIAQPVPNRALSKEQLSYFQDLSKELKRKAKGS